MTTEPVTSPARRWAEAMQTWVDGWAALADPFMASDAPPRDPFQLWRRAFDQWLEGWSLFFDQTLSTPETAAASGRLLDARLNIEKPLREQTAQLMADWLEFLNMASYQEQVRIARQLNDANLRLDELRELIEVLADEVADATSAGRRAPRTDATHAGGDT